MPHTGRSESVYFLYDTTNAPPRNCALSSTFTAHTTISAEFLRHSLAHGPPRRLARIVPARRARSHRAPTGRAAASPNGLSLVTRSSHMRRCIVGALGRSAAPENPPWNPCQLGTPARGPGSPQPSRSSVPAASAPLPRSAAWIGHGEAAGACGAAERSGRKRRGESAGYGSGERGGGK